MSHVSAFAWSSFSHTLPPEPVWPAVLWTVTKMTGIGLVVSAGIPAVVVFAVSCFQ